MATPANSFYKRQLPPGCIAFHSAKGKALFKEALDEGNLESYFSLSLQFLTQSEPAYCGLGSLCMVLNALEIDPMRLWKGVWRWYDETMLDCCRTLEEIQRSGITLPEFTCLARCNGLQAQMRRADQIRKEQFQQDIQRTCRSEAEYTVVSFSRLTLGQTGDGHFSPIGGYNAEKRMVLVLDVARFKYPSYVTSYINLNPTHQYNHVMKWVSLDTLWDSLHPLDGSTQKPRGYVILSKGSRAYLKSAMSHLSLNTSSWPKLAEIMFRQLPEKCSALPDNYSMSEFLSLVISLIPDEYDSLVEDRLPLFTPSYIQRGLDGLPPDSSDLLESDGLKEYLTGLDKLLEQVSSTSLYHLVSKSFALKRKMERIASMSSLILPLHESRSNSPFPSDINTTPTFQALERVRTSSLTDRSVDRSPLMESRQNSLSGYPPSPGIPAVNRLLVFSSVLNRRESFAEILPPPVNVNEFTAFMTMFLFALFAYHPLIDKLSSSRPKEMRTVFDVSKLPEPLSTEVQLLKDQMFALTECCQKCHAC